MNKHIDKFIAALTKELGYKEYGYNHTKFGKYIDENFPDFYNGEKDGQPWCCVFIHAIMIQTFGYENTMLLTNLHERNSGAGCEGCANAYRSGGQRIKGRENVQIGDQVIYGSTSYNHTGVVYDVIDSAKGIYLCIEGNYMDSVSLVRRTYDEMIFCGRPRWEILDEEADTTESVAPKKYQLRIEQLDTNENGSSGVDYCTIDHEQYLRIMDIAREA